MSSIDEQLSAIRAELEKIHSRLTGQQGLPTVLAMKEAARELSISLTTLKELVRRREILTVMIGKRRMVPASEIRRMASIHEEKKPEKTTRSGLQDPEAGLASLRSRRR